MMCETVAGKSVEAELVGNYFNSLVNAFFKVLPMRENNEATLLTYLQSLQLELLGCGRLIPQLCTDPQLLSLLSVLQAFIDEPEMAVDKVRREVFKSIRICNKLKDAYSKSEVQKDVAGLQGSD